MATRSAAFDLHVAIGGVIYVRCPHCARPIRAADDQAGGVVVCLGCERPVPCPTRRGPARSTAIPPAVKAVVLAALGVALVVMGWAAWAAIRATPDTPAGALSAADARQRELLMANIDRQGDPDLTALYAEINTRHLGGRLPTMPVVWEARLAEIGDLANHAFTLEGMFGHFGSRTAILMNTSLRHDRAALRRALSHEMVHAYLYEIGDHSTNHGPAFRLELQRLSAEGAFEGVVASEQERQALREWLDAESAQLDEQGATLEREAEALTAERAAIEQLAGEAAAPIVPTGASGREGGAGPMTDDVHARREAYNRRVEAASALAERGRDAIAAFNRQAARYNLMLVYPDGTDDAAPMAPRASK